MGQPPYTQIVYAPGGGKLALMSGQTLTKAFLPGGGMILGQGGSGLEFAFAPGSGIAQGSWQQINVAGDIGWRFVPDTSTFLLAANNWQPGPDPVATQNSMRNTLIQQTKYALKVAIVKDGICGGSPSGAVEEGRVGGFLKSAGAGAWEGSSFGPIGTVVGGLAGGILGSEGGVATGGVTAGVCWMLGVYNWP